MIQKVFADAHRLGREFDPFWHTCIAAGRAAEGLREEWRRQLTEVQKDIGFDYIRFHGLLHDDMMVYREDTDGKAIYNWQYVDSLFDFLLSVDIRPMLELGFMPYDLSSTKTHDVFWWKGNCYPPKNWDAWFALVRELVVHCVNRYGLTEVLSWYFEVWNEPDLLGGFWKGTKEEYFKLYAYSVRAIKSIDERLRVGGPATSASHAAEPPWVRELIEYCDMNKLPLDFVSTHPYPNNWPLDNWGNGKMVYREKESTLNDMMLVRDILKQTNREELEVHLTEWNSSPSARDFIHDTAFMAPFIIHNNLKCLGLCDSLAFWVFTDIFEEGRAGDGPFHGGFGMINVQGLKKASYYGYWFLSRLGDEILTQGENYIVTKSPEGLQVLLWNYCFYNQGPLTGDLSALTLLDRYGVFEENSGFDFDVTLEGLTGTYKILQYDFDRQNGSVYDEWVRNGAVVYPTQEDLEILRQKTGPRGTIRYADCTGALRHRQTVAAHGVTLLDVRKVYN